MISWLLREYFCYQWLLNLQLHTTYPANIAPVEPVRIPDTAPTECEILKIYLLKLCAIYRIGYVK